MRIRGWLILILIIIIVLGVLALYIADRFFNIDLNIRLSRTEKTAVSVAVLEEVKEILSVNTVEYVYKTVFPYDFVSPGTDWNSLLAKRRANQPLTGQEEKQLEVYDLSRDVGISLDSRDYVFVVITSVVTGGFDLQGAVYENLEENILIDEDTKTLSIRLPEPQIVDLIIEDSTSETYKYPDLGIEPENWRKLTGFIAGEIEGKVIEEGILDTAKTRGQEFFRRLFLEAGYNEIIFVEDL